MHQSTEVFHRLVGSYPIIELATLAYLTDPQGNLLMTQIEDDGYWRLPGGAMLTEEDLMNALQRTVLTQTGVLIESAFLIRIFSDVGQRYIESDDAHIFPVYAVFSAEALSGKLERVEGSKRKFCFFASENIPLDRVFPPMLPAVRFFMKHFSDGLPARFVDTETFIRYERSGELPRMNEPYEI